jgi:hypothetical protein
MFSSVDTTALDGVYGHPACAALETRLQITSGGARPNGDERKGDAGNEAGWPERADLEPQAGVAEPSGRTTS